MPHQDCIAFLKWCLPRLGLRWQGYRKVHRLVCKRLNRRMGELGLTGFSHYETWLLAHPDEWSRIAALCRIPISRFYRDKDVFDAVAATVFPEAAMSARRSGIGAVRCWSVGCASGEEPYTLTLLWHFRAARDFPALDLAVIATDADEVAISRAKTACYGPSALKDLPHPWLEQTFQQSNGLFCLKPELRDRVDLRLQDIRQAMPDGSFEIILCRNLVFTYFDETLQRKMLASILDRLVPGGFLILGKHEVLPAGTDALTPLARGLPIYRRVTPSESEPRGSVG